MVGAVGGGRDGAAAAGVDTTGGRFEVVEGAVNADGIAAACLGADWAGAGLGAACFEGDGLAAAGFEDDGLADACFEDDGFGAAGLAAVCFGAAEAGFFGEGWADDNLEADWADEDFGEAGAASPLSDRGASLMTPPQGFAAAARV